MIKIEKITEEAKGKVKEIIERNWGSKTIVSRGKAYKVNNLPGFVVYYNGKLQGVITYQINDNQCEVVTLNSLLENKGLGSKLLEEVVATAQKQECERVWLVTTNDNIRAIKFYQKRGFELAALHLNAVAKARKIKPEIPEYGFEGIPIKHELEFEKKL